MHTFDDFLIFRKFTMFHWFCFIFLVTETVDRSTILKSFSKMFSILKSLLQILGLWCIQWNIYSLKMSTTDCQSFTQVEFFSSWETSRPIQKYFIVDIYPKLIFPRLKWIVMSVSKIIQLHKSQNNFSVILRRLKTM